MFISAFGDNKRSLLSQFKDLLKFLFSQKGYKIFFGAIKSLLRGETKISKKINDG